jgi:hypothetical protein
VEEYYLDVTNGRITSLEISGSSLFAGKLLIDGAYIIALAPHTVMLNDKALTDGRIQENGLLSSMELARDKATGVARHTVSLLSNSINRIRGAAKGTATQEPVVDIAAQEGEPEVDADTEVLAKEGMPSDHDGAGIIEPPDAQPLIVEILTPEEAGQEEEARV